MYFPLSTHKTVFGIGHEDIVDAAARRQKWTDQSQSINLFLAAPALKTLSHIYRRPWVKASRCGAIKTTYYLRTLQASNIEKTTVEMNKEQRGVLATQTAATAAAAPEKGLHRSPEKRLLHRRHDEWGRVRGVPVVINRKYHSHESNNSF